MRCLLGSLVLLTVLAAGAMASGPWAVASPSSPAKGAQAPDAHPTGRLADRVTRLIEAFDGTVTLYAKNLRTGQDFAVEADTRVRTASTIKLPVLCTLEQLVAEGKVDWNERIALTPDDRVSGSGVLQALADGTDLTIRNLAILMIIVSDNAATNLILDRITTDAVNEYLEALGLTETRVNRKIMGGDVGAAGWSAAGVREENKRFGLGVSTPREMVTLLERLHQGKIVSAEASQDVLDILKKQQLDTGISRHAPQEWSVANKNGSLNALRSDVGIVFTGEDPIALAITVDDMPEADYSPDNVGEKLIWELTEVLVGSLSAS